jgi:hypothetical protein
MDVTTNEQLNGASDGGITIGDGGTLLVNGLHEGSIDLGTGAVLEIHGTVRGAVTIGSLATVLVWGDLVGPVEVRVAGTLVIEPSGRIAGSVKNFGSFTNRGLRAGLVEGRMPDDQSGSVQVEAAHVGGATYQLPERTAPLEN